jgi:hypothetical protein
LDRDGFVGQEDYRLAKQIDTTKKGYLSHRSQQEGRRIIADEFFKKHRNNLSKFGGNYHNNTHLQNVDNMINGNFKI